MSLYQGKSIREARLSATHDISVVFRDAIIPFSSQDMATILVKANADYESLTDIEVQRIIVLMGQFLAHGKKLSYSTGRIT